MSDDKQWKLGADQAAQAPEDAAPGADRSDPLLTPAHLPLLERSKLEDEIKRPVVMSNPKGSIYDTTRFSGWVALGLTMALIIAGVVGAVIWILA